MSLSEKMWRSNYLQMLKQKQHLILSYFKTLSVGQVGNQTRASHRADWHLTNWANQVAITIKIYYNYNYYYYFVVINNINIYGRPYLPLSCTMLTMTQDKILHN